LKADKYHYLEDKDYLKDKDYLEDKYRMAKAHCSP
jgi:hypothetical protein